MQNTIVKEFQDDPRVVTASMSQGESGETLETFWRNLYLRGTMIFDLNGQVAGNDYAQPFTGLPFSRTFVLGPDHRVVLTQYGYNPKRIIEQTHELLDEPCTPWILEGPRDQTACLGGPVTFVVQATGSLPLAYQWRKDGVAIPGATSETHTIVSAGPADAGLYSVVVSTSCSETTSNAANLTVSGSPPTPGDLNCDGRVGLDDVGPFVVVLLGHGDGPGLTEAADLNDDGGANGLDIQPFIDALAPG